MIFVKNYRNPLESFGSAHDGGKSLGAELARHPGEMITVFTDSGGRSGDGFTGLLLEVNDGFIKLLTHPATPPGQRISSFCPGTVAVVSLDHIVAFACNQ